VQNTVDDYNEKAVTVNGLRIFSIDSGNGFEFILDGEVLFFGDYSQGILSSYRPSGYIMYDEVDGIRITLEKPNSNDMRKDPNLLDALEDLGFSQQND